MRILEALRRADDNDGFSWTPLHRLLAILMAGLAVITGISLIDYSVNTFDRTRDTTSNELSSEMPLTAFRDVTGYAKAFRGFMRGEVSYATLAERSSAIRQDILDSPQLNTLMVVSPEGRAFSHALDFLEQTQNRMRDSPQQLLQLGNEDGLTSQYIDVLESSGFAVITTFFVNRVTNFAFEARLQYERALRTLFLFIALSVLVGGFSVRVARLEIMAGRRRTAREEELSQLSLQLDEARDSVRDVENLSVKNNDYLSTANHELRTPLTSIIGYIGLLKDEKSIREDAQLSSFIEVMERNSEVLLETIEDILTMSKYESPSQEINFSSVELLSGIIDQVAELEGLFQAKAITVEVVHDEASYAVCGEAVQLRQVARNVISNAIKYSPEGSKVTAAITRGLEENGARYVELEVSDQGIGIPEDELPMVFDKFFRASNAESSAIRGTGLGLGIAKTIVERFDGKISVESILGSGTTFTIRYPACKEAADQMIEENRAAVLQKAIDSIQGTHIGQLHSATHEHGGAIGFYGFQQESKSLLALSEWLEDNSDSNEEIALAKRDEALRMLRAAQGKTRPTVEQ